jgi:hypothetical protein
MITGQSTKQMTVTEAPLFLKREALRQFFNQGIKPVDGRQPIPEELAQDMVQELIEFDVPKDALIGVVDSFMILTLVLQEHGFTNLVLLENTHNNLTSLHEKYYDTIEGACEKIGVKYYVPPMNNYSRCDMKFDVVIGNPPYQSPNSGGSLRGSSNSALWWKISKQSLGLLKPNGLISYVTPSTIVSGGDSFTTLFLGANRKYDLKKVDFSANDHFNVGIPICRWVAVNSLTENNIINIDKKTLNADTTVKITKDFEFDTILSTLFSNNRSKFSFNTNNRYDYQNIERYLKNEELPIEWAKDLLNNKTEIHQYPVNVNGKIKYSRIKWKDYGVWRLFIAKMTSPLTIDINQEWSADPSTFTMRFDSEEEAIKVKSHLDNPIYKWIIEKTRVSGRINGTTISKMPNAPIEEVLSSEQLSYIQSQL